MCGIAGIVRPRPDMPVERDALLRMARAIRHRGPDGFGTVEGQGAALTSARLAIFDIPGGWQPLRGRHDGSVLVYNGEIYNHPELRVQLARRGYEMETSCDTEVLHTLLQVDGLAALDRLNGQFAFAWWDPSRRRLTLVRDRFGVRPLHLSLLDDGTLVFGSEAKALFASGKVEARPDYRGLDQVFTLWGPLPPRTAFAGVQQLGPGEVLVWEAGRIVERRAWWSPESAGAPDFGEDALESLLRESVRLRLRADVPVGTYLSGGLDSSLITALAQEERGGTVSSFSVAFSDPAYDERPHQERVAEALGTEHHAVEVGYGEIAAAFPDVVRHAEVPLVRTAPVPLYLLAETVRDQGITVVATGEGADEVFWGYDLFKEVALRELHDTEPELALELLGRLYPHLGGDGRRGDAWQRSLLAAGSGGDPLASHGSRATATAAVKAFYSEEVRGELASAPDTLDELRGQLPPGIVDGPALDRAAWLEIRTLLEPYLLSAQADRVSMAHGVEGRFPFLDHRVYACAAALPPERKLEGMRDKAALRDIAERVLPPEVARRVKQPYRAPEVRPFFGEDAPDWVEDLLAPAGLEETGIWDPARVQGLVRRCREGRAQGMREGMALVGVLSTQIWHERLCRAGADAYEPETAEPRVRVQDLEKEPIGEG